MKKIIASTKRRRKQNSLKLGLRNGNIVKLVSAIFVKSIFTGLQKIRMKKFMEDMSYKKLIATGSKILRWKIKRPQEKGLTMLLNNIFIIKGSNRNIKRAGSLI